MNAVRELVRWRHSIAENLQVIDARPVEFYRGDKTGAGVIKAGHIPGAVSVPWTINLNPDGTLKSERDLRQIYSDAGVKSGSTVIVYCRTGMEASMSYLVLRSLGFDPELYDGSFVEWNSDETVAVTAAK